MPYSINKQSIACYSQVKILRFLILRRKKNGEEEGTSSLSSRIFIWSSKTYLSFMKSNCHCEKYCNFAWFIGVEILWKGTVLTWFRAIRPKLCENFLFAKFPQQEIRWNYGIFRSVYFWGCKDSMWAEKWNM